MGSVLSTVTVTGLWGVGSDLFGMLQPLLLLGMGIVFAVGVFGLVWRYGHRLAGKAKG